MDCSFFVHEALLSSSPLILIDEIENAGVDRKSALNLLVRTDKIILSTGEIWTSREGIEAATRHSRSPLAGIQLCALCDTGFPPGACGNDAEVALESPIPTRSQYITLATHDPEPALSPSRWHVFRNGGGKEIVYRSDNDKRILDKLVRLEQVLFGVRNALRNGEPLTTWRLGKS